MPMDFGFGVKDFSQNYDKWFGNENISRNTLGGWKK